MPTLFIKIADFLKRQQKNLRRLIKLVCYLSTIYFNVKAKDIICYKWLKGYEMKISELME